MFENVLVGVDGTPNGRDAVALATRLLTPGGRLTLAHVRAGELQPLHAATPGMVAEEHAASQKLLEDERDAIELPVTLISIVGSNPGRELHRQAEEQGADLIAVGSSRRGYIGRVMLGDDTRGALNGAPCAVAIASRGYAESPKPIADIGVGYNGSPEAKAALEMALRVAAPTRARVRALEVVSIPTYAYTGAISPTIGDGLDVVLDEASKRMGALADVDEGRAVYGLTGEELAAFGEEVDLLEVLPSTRRFHGP